MHVPLAQNAEDDVARIVASRRLVHLCAGRGRAVDESPQEWVALLQRRVLYVNEARAGALKTRKGGAQRRGLVGQTAEDGLPRLSPRALERQQVGANPLVSKRPPVADDEWRDGPAYQ